MLRDCEVKNEKRPVKPWSRRAPAVMTKGNRNPLRVDGAGFNADWNIWSGCRQTKFMRNDLLWGIKAMSDGKLFFHLPSNVREIKFPSRESGTLSHASRTADGSKRKKKQRSTLIRPAFGVMPKDVTCPFGLFRSPIV